MREPFTRLHVHVVWATWNRLPLITSQVEGAIYSCIRAEAESLGAEVVAIGGIEDHVHVLVRIPATVSLAALGKRMKGGSSHLATHMPNAPDFFKWQGGYGAFTVSSWDVGRVRAYIRRQREHHQTGSLSATLERIERK